MNEVPVSNRKRIQEMLTHQMWRRARWDRAIYASAEKSRAWMRGPEQATYSESHVEKKRLTTQKMFLTYQATRLTKEKKFSKVQAIRLEERKYLMEKLKTWPRPERISPDPVQPTQEKVDNHEVDHMPFRQWCEEHVKGRDTGEQHRSRVGSHATVAFNYVFRRDQLESEEVKKTGVKIMVVTDLKNERIFAHVVPQKGSDAEGYAVLR